MNIRKNVIEISFLNSKTLFKNFKNWLFEEPLQDPGSTVGESLILCFMAGRTKARTPQGRGGDGQKYRGLPLLLVVTQAYHNLCDFLLGES